MNPTRRTHGLTVGPESESIFASPLWGMMDRTENELPELFKKMESADDHRLLALVTALIVEERVDKLLSAYLPRYSVLRDGGEFTFSMKIRLLESLNLIPRHITAACHVLRAIRNDFAHRLELVAFTDLPKKTWKKLEVLLEKRPDLKNFDYSRDEFSRNFRAVSFTAIIGLDAFLVSVEKLRSKMKEPAFVRILQEEHHAEFDAKFKTAKAAGPRSYSQASDGKWRYEYAYFVETSELPPEQFLANPKNRPEAT